MWHRPKPVVLRTAEHTQDLVASGKLLRVAVLGAIAVQMALGWAYPLLTDQATTSQRVLIDGEPHRMLSDWVRLTIGAWALVTSLGHLASLVLPHVQRVFGATHAIGCVMIGVRLIQMGDPARGWVYAIGWAALGIVISITSERRPTNRGAAPANEG